MEQLKESINRKEPDHLNLLFDMGELASIITSGSDIEAFLTGATELVAKHLKAHVCSIYLFDSRSKALVLRATRGLKPEAVNRVRMLPGEGLVGQCFSQDRILRVGNARTSPGFKYFDNAGEEPFNSFLCVPIRRGVVKIGVLVVQQRQMDHFTLLDERALRTAATQLAGAIENARLLMALASESDTPGDDPDITSNKFPAFIKGKSNGSGMAIGTIRPSRRRRKAILLEEDTSNITYSLADFQTAVEKTIDELKDLQDKFAASLPESESLIFTAHFMMLKDKNFTGKMKSLVEQGLSPVAAIQQVTQKYIKVFSDSPHAYMQEKAVDVEDLGIRLLSHLKTVHAPRAVDRGTIFVTQDIYPSDMLKLTADGIRGIVLVSGGVTSHVAILARSLSIPLIIADDPVFLDLPDTTRLLLDAGQGNIYINPDDNTLSIFKANQEVENRAKARQMKPVTYTLDNRRIRLLANINLLSEIDMARELKAEGIGLYRTEFPFLIRSGFPSEDEQYLIYKGLFDKTEPGTVTTVRTLDAGGEKVIKHADFIQEANPALGLRSIRFSLKYRQIFQTQIKAILRAAHGREKVRLMFPLICSIDEFLEAKQIVAQCVRQMEIEGVSHKNDPELGLMIELPSVLATIDEFAELTDFFAIGTNDFIQYMLGADRSNKLVADHYIPYHPAVNRGIAKIAEAATGHGIDVSVCGEMAHDPDHIPFLIGVGITTLSVDPKFLPRVQTAVMETRFSTARDYARRLLDQTRVKDAADVFNTRPGKCSPAEKQPSS
ncbi:phosphoenolpyruvate--protein phosphotransferase [uncultured Desulfobacter sp.]|uniref:phosphoenolpyruvate--protein phosphotransferase n=1 Tax=uncultured Desulfobacter sp. TaxID=240139 RepID=UPI002AAC17B2|nr:phosphoenolpyruvate--protein phosphotransferase [uncultured Desulfobacter sp.]